MLHSIDSDPGPFPPPLFYPTFFLVAPGRAPHQGQLAEQIRRTVAGEELLKNGAKPAEEDEEDEEEELDMGGADDYDSDLGF